LRFAVLDPALEDVDPSRGPGVIARHGAVSEACEDGVVGVLADIVMTSRGVVEK
jgi:hypothetical protein